VHLLSAYEVATGIVLAQVAVDAKSNEISAFAPLLEQDHQVRRGDRPAQLVGPRGVHPGRPPLDDVRTVVDHLGSHPAELPRQRDRGRLPLVPDIRLVGHASNSTDAPLTARPASLRMSCARRAM